MTLFKLTIVAAILASVGCAVRRGSGPPQDRPSDSRPILGWRLTEEKYGAIDDWWATAGDGEIPPDAIALVYEPVYQEETTLIAGLVTGRTACSHAPCVEYEGPRTRNVGDPATVSLWVDGPRDVGHVVELTGSHASVRIVNVTGAVRLLEEGSTPSNRYYLAPRARAEISFTSEIQGRAGLRISVVGDIVSGGRTDSFRRTDSTVLALKGLEERRVGCRSSR